MRYFALIDGEPGAYGVVFPDLLGCTAMGDTLDDAMVAAGEAMTDWASTYEGNGGTLPAARTAEELSRDPEVAAALVEGACWASVPLVRSSGRTIRANLSLDAGILAALDAAADARNVTRSGMVSILVRQHLHEVG